MVPVITGGLEPKREFLYWEQNLWNQKDATLRADRLSQAVRMGAWKAVRARLGAPLELYDLNADPGETTDVATRNPQVLARTEHYLKGARTEPRPHRGSMRWVT
jgi:arylsulfatase A-like enzyme